MPRTTKTIKKATKKEVKARTLTADVLEAAVYNTEGKAVGKISLPESVFGLKFNHDLVHQVVTSMMSSRRAGTAHTKFRGEVRGGGKKPWRQKGTGRARHGSRRSPIWRGGGVTHGPRAEKNYERKVNNNMRRKALRMALSAKLRDGEILFVDDLKIKEIKTKEAKVIFNKLAGIKGFEKISGKKKNAVMLALPGKDVKVEKSFRNFGNISVVESRNLNPVDILNYKYLAIVNPASYLKSVKL